MIIENNYARLLIGMRRPDCSINVSSPTFNDNIQRCSLVGVKSVNPEKCWEGRRFASLSQAT